MDAAMTRIVNLHHDDGCLFSAFRFIGRNSANIVQFIAEALGGIIMPPTKGTSLPCPVRCFLRDVPEKIRNANPPTLGGNTVHLLPLFRLLGTVIDVRDTAGKQGDALSHYSDEENDKKETASVESSRQTEDNDIAITLDDGTATLTIYASRSMKNQISVSCGMSLDCIVRVNTVGRLNGDSNDGYELTADQLVVVDDKNAETLRWLEITFRESLKNQPDSANMNCDWGFPARYFDADDLYHVILSDYDTCRDFKPKEEAGVSLDDLSMVLDIPMDQLQKMIEELQLSGQIYRNRSGLFLPL
jgi:hypothetical protein